MAPSLDFFFFSVYLEKSKSTYITSTFSTLKTFFKNIYFLLHWVFVAAQLSLVAESKDSSAAVCRLLLALASLVAEPRLQSTGSVVVVLGLSYPETCGIFPDQGLNLCPLHWQADSQPLGHQGRPTSSTLVEYRSCHYVVEMIPSEKNSSKSLKYHSLCTEDYIPF